MFDGVIDEFVDAGVAIQISTPVWMDKDSNIVTEQAFGCKVTHDITNPGHIIVLNEVGSQKSDVYIGGELMLCETGKAPQRKINTKSKHYTCLGLTTLSGESVMRCIILAGIKINSLCETGQFP